MTHLSAELLRRFHDDPNALLVSEKEHLLGCTRCRARYETVSANAAFAATALTASEPALDLDAARRAVAARVVEGDVILSGAPAGNVTLSGAREASAVEGRAVEGPLARLVALARLRPAWTSAIAAVAVIAVSVTFAPVRTLAQNFLAIFEVHQFQPIAMTHADLESLGGLPNLDAFGTMRQGHQSGGSPATVNNVPAAERLARQPVSEPRYLPPQIGSEPTISVMQMETESFTFSSARARQWATDKGVTLRPMPARLDGSTIVATLGPVVVSHFAEGQNGTTHTGLQIGHVRSIRHGRVTRSYGMRDGGDQLIVVQAPSPRVYSTGASVAEILDYMMSQPGVSPSLAAQIRAIGDPSTTLPIPIPIDKTLAQRVFVGGVPGLAIGDETGVGSIVMWQRGGIVHAVTGPFAEQEVLAVANSLSP